MEERKRGGQSGNQNARKAREGITVSVYLSVNDISAMRNRLQSLEIEPTEQAIRRRAIDRAKAGIYSDVKDYLDAIYL